MSVIEERYRKQTLFAGIGPDGQARLEDSTVFVCGCGALGSVVAEAMVRAGVGTVRLADRDFVELSNLQRQVLYDEDDVARHLPKAVAAAEKLARINSLVCIEPHVVDIGPDNVRDLVAGCDLILDGTDNFEVRFLLNDVALETGIPWIYTGCVGSHGQIMPVFPGESACLRCLMADEPESGSLETCDTAGVIGPAVSVVAGLESAMALKILSGHREQVAPELTVIDAWDLSFRKMNLGNLRDSSECPACHVGERKWLRGERGARTSILCGRNAVQISPPKKQQIVLAEMAARLASIGTVEANDYLVRLSLADPECVISIFRDGRAIVQGTDDPAQARSLYARYIGA